MKKSIRIICSIFVILIFLLSLVAIFRDKIQPVEAADAKRFIVEQPLSYYGSYVGYIIQDTKTGKIYLMVHQGGIIKVEE
jgi:predicted small secreted protein